jgi:tetratricopeptide (TPR) repeat protein
MHAIRVSPCRRFVRPGGRAPRLRSAAPAPGSRSGAVKLRLIVVLLLLGGFVGAGVYATMRVDTEPVPSLIKKMRETFADGEGMIRSDPKKALAKYVETEAYAQRILEKEPKSTEGLLYYGQSLVRQERPEEALKYFLQSPDSESQAAAWCHLSAGQILCNNHSKYVKGEEQYRRALELQTGEPTATWLLSQVMKVGARDWELLPLELAEIEQREHLNIQLMNDLSRNERLIPDMGIIMKGLKENPDDPNVLIGQSQLLRVQGKYHEAEASLRRAIEVAPQLDEAQVRLGWVLFESGDDAKFLKWHADVKPSLEDHPLLWSVRGARAQRANENEVAARCYWEAIKRDPNLQDALYQLGLLLTSMNRKTDATPFLERAQKLVDYMDLVIRNHFQAYEQKKGDVELSTRAIKAAFDLGNLWEAYAWTAMTFDLDPSNKGLESELKQSEGVLKNVEKRRTLPNFNPANKVDLAKLPLPKWTVESAIPSLKPVASPVSFEDQAAVAGVKFQYFDGSDPAVDGLNKMHQVNGGGGGVVDFDRDGWPDLYLSQGSAEPQDREQTAHLDRLFRNMGDGHFADVTAQAHLVENGFSQGVSVGDIDNDGFPDVYVANVGANRLFMNNGDGTFSDVSEESGATESQWTTSCVIADMNGDSLPDIYAVGYLEGDALTRVCNDGKHHYPCLTFGFPTARHRLWLNQGDGKFEDATATAQIERYSDRGTSVIAANVDGSRKLDLLVGNSGTQNYFFKNGVDKKGDPPKFTEASLSQGLALGANGEPRKCLGLAAGDFNGDGLLDFHGTSITEEPDTLYVQQKGGCFFDNSFSSGLHAPTYMRTSYGTQAIDGSLDGKLDLFSSGGNVDNLHNVYIKYEMPPAYFANDGQGHFTMASAESLGPYFQKAQVGRAVTRLDWNRDGLDDLLVYHSRAPVALLTNTTRKHGHHLTIRLVSTGSARDSIGTTVEVVAGGKKIVRQLTAGDGFQASNERALVFGLGANTKVDSIVIHWMSGREQRLAGVPGDQEILFVEGREQPTTLTRD